LSLQNITHLEVNCSRNGLLPWWCRGAFEKLFQYLSCLRKLIKVIKCCCRCTCHWWWCCWQWHCKIRFRRSGKDALPTQSDIVQSVPPNSANNTRCSVTYSPEGSLAVVGIQKGKPTDSEQRAAQDVTVTHQVAGAHSVEGTLHILLWVGFQSLGEFLWYWSQYAQEKGSHHPGQTLMSQPTVRTNTLKNVCITQQFWYECSVMTSVLPILVCWHVMFQYTSNKNDKMPVKVFSTCHYFWDNVSLLTSYDVKNVNQKC